ncbi:transcriptional regulator [human gut metagenome]|uniref:Transcriptional regulator n=1 Tax=human gut metagenome TaxID=408170 RepID=K1TVJ2_9ZZZZ
MEHTERAWHEERGFAACRRSYHNMIANMGKGKNISMETLVRICEALNCGIMNVIKLEQDNI